MKPTDGAWWAASMHPAEHLVGHRVGQELAAHVAAAEDRADRPPARSASEKACAGGAQGFPSNSPSGKAAAACPGSPWFRLPAGLLTRIHPVAAPSRLETSVANACGQRPPHSAGHVAASHRLPDSPFSSAGQHPETPARSISGGCDGAITADFFHAPTAVSDAGARTAARLARGRAGFSRPRPARARADRAARSRAAAGAASVRANACWAGHGGVSLVRRGLPARRGAVKPMINTPRKT
jgi:hypothetical protein